MWKATCQGISLSKEKNVRLHLRFTGYTGDKNKLSNKDLKHFEASSCGINIPVSRNKGPAKHCPGELNPRLQLVESSTICAILPEGE